MTFLRAALWAGIVVLVVVGIVAASIRTIHVTDAGVRLELARQRVFPSIPRFIPDQTSRMREMREFDAPFARHAAIARIHVIAGGAFLLLAPLQFVRPLRRRYANAHRWTGRALLGAGFITGLSGLFFGLMMPFAGSPEAIAIALAGGLLLFSMGRGFVLIRSGEIAPHREWMIRAFAVAIGISTVRVMGGILDAALAPHGYSSREVFVLSVWIGWVLTIAAAELWIRLTRHRMETRIA